MISLDPSDPNYMQIATPVTPNIPPVGSQAGIPQTVTNAVNALLQNQAQIVGLEQALVTTLNRAQGASDANNAYWLQQQLDAATLYLGQLSQLDSQMAGLLTQLSSALTAAGLNVTLTANQVLNFEAQVVASGLPAAVVAAMQQFGADDALIEDATDLVFVTNVNDVAGEIPHLLTNSALVSLLQSLQVGPPTDKAQCMNGGWQYFNTPGRFKNQGDCIQYVNTGK